MFDDVEKQDRAVSGWNLVAAYVDADEASLVDLFADPVSGTGPRQYERLAVDVGVVDAVTVLVQERGDRPGAASDFEHRRRAIGWQRSDGVEKHLASREMPIVRVFEPRPGFELAMIEVLVEIDVCRSGEILDHRLFVCHYRTSGTSAQMKVPRPIERRGLSGFAAACSGLVCRALHARWRRRRSTIVGEPLMSRVDQHRRAHDLVVADRRRRERTTMRTENDLMRRAVVTGAAGFIGCHLVEALNVGGVEVVGIDNEASGDWERLRAPCTQVRRDLAEIPLDELTELCDTDVVFHLAAEKYNCRGAIRRGSST